MTAITARAGAAAYPGRSVGRIGIGSGAARAAEGRMNQLIVIAMVVGLLALVVGAGFCLYRGVANFGHFGDGVLGTATGAALLIAGGLYMLEGRTEAKVEIAAEATAVPLAPDPDGVGRVLVQFKARVANSGSFDATYRCIALDALGFRRDGRFDRNARFGADVDLDPLLAETARGPAWEHCLAVEERRWTNLESERIAGQGAGAMAARPFIPPRSGYRYPDLMVPSREHRVRDFELVVSCRYAAARFIFVVPKPDSIRVNEVKTVVSIVEPCRVSEGGRQARRPGRRARARRA